MSYSSIFSMGGGRQPQKRFLKILGLCTLALPFSLEALDCYSSSATFVNWGNEFPSGDRKSVV